MNLPLKKDVQDWIENEVKSGRYHSEAEVVEQALREKMRADDAEYFRDRLRRSEEDIRHGRTVKADDAFFESLRNRIQEIANKSGG